jgi:hypothetical protein
MDGQRPPAHPLLGGESEYVSAQTTVIGKPQRAIGHQGELTQGPAVCQTDRRRPLRADSTPRKGRQATRPATSSQPGEPRRPCDRGRRLASAFQRVGV